MNGSRKACIREDGKIYGSRTDAARAIIEEYQLKYTDPHTISRSISNQIERGYGEVWGHRFKDYVETHDGWTHEQEFGIFVASAIMPVCLFIINLI